MSLETLRVRRWPKTAKMTETQILAAYNLYRNGLSVNQVADLIWKKFGYSNAASCSRTLQRAFHRFGYPMRDLHQAGRLKAERLYGPNCPHSRDPVTGLQSAEYRNQYDKMRHRKKYGEPQRCASNNRDGTPCRRWRMHGVEVCWDHQRIEREAA